MVPANKPGVVIVRHEDDKKKTVSLEFIEFDVVTEKVIKRTFYYAR